LIVNTFLRRQNSRGARQSVAILWRAERVATFGVLVDAMSPERVKKVGSGKNSIPRPAPGRRLDSGKMACNLLPYNCLQSFDCEAFLQLSFDQILSLR
jgi:hypothetical protein